MKDMKMLGHMVCVSSSKEHIENCVIEEMSELTKAICKSRRGKLDLKNMSEELGHTLLMCYALMDCYNLDEQLIVGEAMDAVNRMLKNE